MISLGLQFIALLLSFLSSFVLSTWIIRACIPKLKAELVDTRTDTPGDALHVLLTDGRLPESSQAGRIFDWASTGIWIGLCETFLIFILVFADAFSALAIIIGAKQFVRKENIRLVPSYYLLGTLANLCSAIAFALIAKLLVAAVPAL